MCLHPHSSQQAIKLGMHAGTEVDQGRQQHGITESDAGHTDGSADENSSDEVLDDAIYNESSFVDSQEDVENSDDDDDDDDESID